MGGLDFLFRLADFLQYLLTALFDGLFFLECLGVDMHFVEDILVVAVQTLILLADILYFLLHTSL